MSVKAISVILASVAIASNTVHCTPTCDVPVTDKAGPTTPFPTNLPVPSAHNTLSAELLEVLKNFYSSLPGAGQKTSTAETAPTSPPSANDRISVMHFPTAPAPGSINGATPNLMVPGVIHQRPFSPGYNLQMAEPSPSPIQSRGPPGISLPVSVPPPIAETRGPSSASAPAPDQQSSTVAIPPASSRSPDDLALVKIEPGNNNFNQELIKLLTDMRMTPVSLPEPSAVQGQNQMLVNGPTTRPAQTLPILSPGVASSSLQPPKVTQPILGPNQTPLDYLLSSSYPIHQLNSIPGYSKPSTNTNTWPKAKPPTTAKPCLNLAFVKYLLNLPLYKQALYDLIKAQCAIQT